MLSSPSQQHKGVLLALAVCFLFACSAEETTTNEPPSTSKLQYQSATLEDSRLNETSGLTRSGISDEVLWLHNDSGNSPRLFASSTTGQHLGVLNLPSSLSTIDWEDIALYQNGESNFLVVGDIGDNWGYRDHISLHFINEPELPFNSPFEIEATPARSIEITFPDGPRDCEAMAIDSQNHTVLLLSKRDQPPRLYSAALDSGNEVTAEFLGSVTRLPPPTEQDLALPYGKYSSQPTALDINPAATMIGVQTYKAAYIFKREAGQTWLHALQSDLTVVPAPQLPQTEAGGFSLSGQEWFSASEKRPAFLITSQLP